MAQVQRTVASNLGLDVNLTHRVLIFVRLLSTAQSALQLVRPFTSVFE